MLILRVAFSGFSGSGRVPIQIRRLQILNPQAVGGNARTRLSGVMLASWLLLLGNNIELTLIFIHHASFWPTSLSSYHGTVARVSSAFCAPFLFLITYLSRYVG